MHIAEIYNVQIFIISAMKFGYEAVFIFVDVNPIIQIPFFDDSRHSVNDAVLVIDDAFTINILFLQLFLCQGDWFNILKVNLKRVALLRVYFQV